MRLILVLVLLVLFFFGTILFWPTSDVAEYDVDEEKQNILLEGSDFLKEDSIETNSEQRHELMKQEYEVLEKERRILKQRLGRLKHHLYGLKFDKNKADEMREILLVAHKLIKNPDMLGAFSDVESISNEVSKLKFANKSLDHISEMIQEKKSNKK
ncbi:MAG: hypothetical protein CMF40_03620 [Legionellales bacterium]|nr:hypothetical protein [Legionellales bacterium]|tara:strand:+ start:69 stop:536 length:468 start_codon:yes stop_codon:yes gene_type:complete